MTQPSRGKTLGTELISFGGGVNSVAMTILLVNGGWHGPIVFADTGAEWPETYCYMDYFETEYLGQHGLEIVKLSAPSKYHRKDLRWGLEEYCLRKGMIPLAFMRWCSGKYKQEPIGKWAKMHNIELQLLGISEEEAHRAKEGKGHPLIERGIDREKCRAIIAGAGLEVPPKSSCFFCPFQRKYRWLDLYKFHPDLFDRAAELERNSSRRRGKRATLEPIGRYTLDDLRQSFEAQMELPMFEYENIREFQGCVCTL